MTPNPEVVDLHAVPHPSVTVRRIGFPLNHPYLEHCWAPVIGPSSVLLLRRCFRLWREAEPARIPVRELAHQLGLGQGTGAHSPVWHTLDRVVRFRFAARASETEFHVFTEVPPLRPRQLDGLPGWCQDEHERILAQHLTALATPPNPELGGGAGPHARMAERLQRIAHQGTATPRSLGR